MSNEVLSVQGQLVGIPAEKYEGVSGIVVDPVNKTVALDETVLWSGAYSTSTTSIALSESLSNFERIKVLWQHDNDTSARRMWQEYPNDTVEFFCTLGRADSSSGRILFEAWWTNGTTSLSKKFCRWNYMSNGSAGTSWTDANELVPIKVVGINRKNS